MGTSMQAVSWYSGGVLLVCSHARAFAWGAWGGAGAVSCQAATGLNEEVTGPNVSVTDKLLQLF